MLFEIGKEIRAERKKRKMSQAALAKLLRMSRTTISQIESGTVQDVGVRKLIRILEVLGLELRVRRAGSPPTLDELREEAVLEQFATGHLPPAVGEIIFRLVEAIVQTRQDSPVSIAAHPKLGRQGKS